MLFFVFKDFIYHFINNPLKIQYTYIFKLFLYKNFNVFLSFKVTEGMVNPIMGKIYLKFFSPEELPGWCLVCSLRQLYSSYYHSFNKCVHPA